jgi:hypothetical protein
MCITLLSSAIEIVRQFAARVVPEPIDQPAAGNALSFNAFRVGSDSFCVYNPDMISLITSTAWSEGN